MITRGEQMLELRRMRMTASPAFLRGGFRPFYFGGAAWAVVALTLWLVALAGGVVLPTVMEPLAWHRHEMLFGFVGAVIAGFLLTAIPNWTGRLPIAGLPLAALAGLWLAARMAILFSASIGAGLAAALDIGFFLVLAAVAGREVLAAKNRNFPIVLVVLLFAFASATDHAEAMGAGVAPGLGAHAGILLVVVLISLIGGRIIPSFTRNWLAKQGEKHRLPGQPTRFDIGAIAITVLAMAAWTAAPFHRVAGLLLLLAGTAQLARLSRWGGARSVRDPLVFILHVGFAWLPVGLLLLGASIFVAAVPRTAAIHALTAGAMGSMILAVMTRSTLGHTGRALRADGATVAIYVLVTAGALLRVSAPFGLFDYTLSMRWSAVGWGGAFLLFLIVYGPILFRHRLGDPTK
ncbi:NnrS family protein [Sphingosinicella rhizophila]|uniref:NnrS family protein n=1 Tax=Sphingosinicella rhizophila TaxID=3050082 RepID=A0ABU3QD23_9SPHN|nr:NnrS family protein [Sphingosinicella sp. GR2756]MDT9600865.1 NnrS family protein [Sphingosinicella sp. GR2756]